MSNVHAVRNPLLVAVYNPILAVFGLRGSSLKTEDITSCMRFRDLD